MTEQPEALRLANALEWPFSGPAPLKEAAAELRRLHEVNQELLKALKVGLRDFTAVYDVGDVEMQPALYQARAAIAKAQGEQA